MIKPALFVASLVALLLSGPAWSQAMMSAPPTTGSTDSMMAPALPAMGSAMSYDSLKKAGMLADPITGSRLRKAPGTGRKVLFTNLQDAVALAKKGPTVLFFSADWCPSCQADLRDINALGSRLGTITIVVVDYDHSADLKAMYGITVQDSFVQIDAKGGKLGAWNGGGVEGVLSHVKKVM